MKIHTTILLALFLQSILSCHNNTNQNSKPIERTNIPTIDTARISPSEIKHLDSSKLIKAFDNISFGLPESIPIYKESGYAINRIPFEISNTQYSGDFGLYYFQLTTSIIIDYDDLNKTLDEIISIINIKYDNPVKINIIIPDELKKLFSKGQLPKDDGTLYYKYQWIKNGVKINLGYEVGYRYENEKELGNSHSGGIEENDSKNLSKSIKTVLPKINFEYLPISDKLEKENKNIEKNRIKKEAEKL